MLVQILLRALDKPNLALHVLQLIRVKQLLGPVPSEPLGQMLSDIYVAGLIYSVD